MCRDPELDGPGVVRKKDSRGHGYRVKIHEPGTAPAVPPDQQQPGESDKDFYRRWAKHARQESAKGPGRLKAVWLTDGIGRKVEISCMRSPKVIGVVRQVDLRFGKVLVACETEDVELTMSDIAQVRYPK